MGQPPCVGRTKCKHPLTLSVHCSMAPWRCLCARGTGTRTRRSRRCWARRCRGVPACPPASTSTRSGRPSDATSRTTRRRPSSGEFLVYRARLKGGRQVWRILFQLWLSASAWLCLQHSRNLGPSFSRALYTISTSKFLLLRETRLTALMQNKLPCILHCYSKLRKGGH